LWGAVFPVEFMEDKAALCAWFAPSSSQSVNEANEYYDIPSFVQFFSGYNTYITI
jgi:hypothetical protein